MEYLHEYTQQSYDGGYFYSSHFMDEKTETQEN